MKIKVYLVVATRVDNIDYDLAMYSGALRLKDEHKGRLVQVLHSRERADNIAFIHNVATRDALKDRVAYEGARLPDDAEVYLVMENETTI